VKFQRTINVKSWGSTCPKLEACS